MVVQSISAILVGLAAAFVPFSPCAYAHPGERYAARDGTAGDSLLTPGTYLAQVLERNPGLAAARERARAVRSRLPQATAWDAPLAGVEFYATPVSSANPLRDGMETDYFLQQMIPFPGKTGAMGDAAEAEARMAEQSALEVERGLVADAKRAYAMLFSVRRRQAVNDENQRLLGQIIASARSKYGVGVGTQADVLKVQVELASLQNGRSALDQEETTSVAMLNALRGAPSGTTPVRIADPAIVPPPPSLDSLLHDGGTLRPGLLAMQYRTDMSRAELAASKREWIPDFMVKGTYKQMTGQTDQWAAMIGISIPVAPWSIGRAAGKVGEDEANLNASQEALRDMRNMVEAEIRAAFARAHARWEQIGRYDREILPQAGQALEANLASYRSDKVDFLSLLDSYRMLQMYRMEYAMLLGEYGTDLAELERAVGGELQ